MKIGNETPGARTDRRLRFLSKLAIFLVVFPFIVSAFLIIIIVYQNADFYIDYLRNATSVNLNDLMYASEVFAITAILHLIVLHIVYLYLMVNHREQVFRNISFISKIGMALPVAFFGFAILYFLRFLGYTPGQEVSLVVLCVLFAFGLIPTSISLITDHVPIAWEGFNPIFDEGLAVGGRRYQVIFDLHLLTPNTRRYLISISLFSSLRVVAEISFFKELLSNGESLSFREFTGEFFGNMNPEEFATFGLIFLLVGFLGIVIAAISARV